MNKKYKVYLISTYQHNSNSIYGLEKLLNEGWRIERVDSPHIVEGQAAQLVYILVME